MKKSEKMIHNNKSETRKRTKFKYGDIFNSNHFGVLRLNIMRYFVIKHARMTCEVNVSSYSNVCVFGLAKYLWVYDGCAWFLEHIKWQIYKEISLCVFN